MTGHAYLTSASAEEAAQESDRIGSSFFTHYLISGLRGAADTAGDGIVTLNEAYTYAFQETLASTEKTQYGPQHPAYDINLSGSGDLVLTDLRSSSAILRVGEDVAGRLYLRDADGNLAVELNKAGGQKAELGLEPGAIQRRPGHEDFPPPGRRARHQPPAGAAHPRQPPRRFRWTRPPRGVSRPTRPDARPGARAESPDPAAAIGAAVGEIVGTAIGKAMGTAVNAAITAAGQRRAISFAAGFTGTRCRCVFPSGGRRPVRACRGLRAPARLVLCSLAADEGVFSSASSPTFPAVCSPPRSTTSWRSTCSPAARVPRTDSRSAALPTSSQPTSSASRRPVSATPPWDR